MTRTLILFLRQQNSQSLSTEVMPTSNGPSYKTNLVLTQVDS